MTKLLMDKDNVIAHTKMETKPINNTTRVENRNREKPKVLQCEENYVNKAMDTYKNNDPSKRLMYSKPDQKSRLTSRRSNSLFLLLRIRIPLCILRHQWILFGFLIVNCASALREQMFAIEPQDQSAVVGSRVTLPCRVEKKSGQLQWTKDDFGLGTHRHLNGYERYKMIGSDEEGDYSLDIREVTLDDDGLYQCQVSTGPKGEQAIRSRYARLTVLMPPEPPRILQGSTIQVIEEQEVNLDCVSAGGKPAAEITWVDSDGGVLTQGVINSEEPMADGRRITARSTLTLKPKRQYHNQTFTCQAQNTADRAYRAATIKLEVKYAPKVKLALRNMPSRKIIREGDTLIAGCQANANPSDVTYKWFINSEQMIGNVSNELILRNISRKYNDALLKCEVHNSVGKSADSKTLEISYGPAFIRKPLNVEAEHGTTAMMSCLVDGHPQPEVFWLRYDNDKIIRVGKSQNLTITVSQSTAGQYWCRASTDGYPDIEAHAMVYVKGPPQILSNKTQYGVEGDSVKIDCVSFSIPKPDFVMWTFGGHEINSFYNQEFAFLEESLHDGMTKSTLIIRASEARHFGAYNCTVANVYGTDSIEIRLIPDKSLPLILIISAGASSATIVLIIMLIIMLCHRRRRKNIPSEIVKKPDITDIGKGCGDQFKDSDRSSNISDFKLELRQVEGSCEMDHTNTLETEFQTNIGMTSNMGLPLAGPVSLPSSGFDNELMKQYQRYSTDFNDPSSMQLKSNQSNGYIPYVDYSRDYVPPVVHSSDSLSESMTRSIDTASTFQYNSGNSQGELGGSLLRQLQGSCGALGGYGGGPDVIPLSNAGGHGVDKRYAATYGNPYLRISGPMSYGQQMNSGNHVPAPPPYYSVKTSNLTPPLLSVTSPSSQSSRPISSSPMGSTTSANSGAQPQVPKLTPQSPNAMYILPPSTQGNSQTQITTKGSSGGTHV